MAESTFQTASFFFFFFGDTLLPSLKQERCKLRSSEDTAISSTETWTETEPILGLYLHSILRNKVTTTDFHSEGKGEALCAAYQT